jgi:phosphate transport system substrate-binding protein
MRKLAIAILGAALVAAAPGARAADISGTGATFPAPVYAKWAEVYKAQTGVGLNYQAIGSGGGVRQIKARTVAFGASDKPLQPKALSEAGLIQFPTVIGGVVPVINVPGLKPNQLKLNGAVLGDIFLGAIKRWNDPKLAALNPGVKLPNLPLTVVHRSDGSGTSFLFTSYLSQKNPAWARKVGAADAVEWPTGLGGKGNDGVAAFVKQTVGAIGYVEYAFAKQNGLNMTLVQNKAGQVPPPDDSAFSAAAASADWSKAPGFYLLLLDQPGPKSWPLTGATFILLQKQQASAANGQSVLKFFDWAYRNGDAQAAQLDYVPLPAPVKALVRKSWAGVTAGGKPVYAGN